MRVPITTVPLDNLIFWVKRGWISYKTHLQPCNMWAFDDPFRVEMVDKILSINKPI